MRLSSWRSEAPSQMSKDRANGARPSRRENHVILLVNSELRTMKLE